MARSCEVEGGMQKYIGIMVHPPTNTDHFEVGNQLFWGAITYQVNCWPPTSPTIRHLLLATSTGMNFGTYSVLQTFPFQHTNKERIDKLTGILDY